MTATVVAVAPTVVAMTPTVVVTIATVVVALSFGFKMAMVMGSACYVLAALSAGPMSAAHPREDARALRPTA